MRKITINIGVCDDDELFLEEFVKDLNGLNFSNTTKKIFTFSSGEELLSSDKPLDTLFLDIKMDGADGMSIAAALRNQGFHGHIIFLTNYPEYMSDAFTVKAFRFLTKPVSKDELARVLYDVEKDIYSNYKIAFNSTSGEASVWLDDILYIESVHNNTYLHTRQNSIRTRIPIRDWLSLLPQDRFIQTHRSYILSLRYVENITSSGIYLSEPAACLPVSKKNIPLVKAAHLSYLDKYAAII